MSGDIFDALIRCVGCEYISDLRFGPNNLKARNCLAETDLNMYPLSALSDAATYIFGKEIHFSSVEDAKNFFDTEI